MVCKDTEKTTARFFKCRSTNKQKCTHENDQKIIAHFKHWARQSFSQQWQPLTRARVHINFTYCYMFGYLARMHTRGCAECTSFTYLCTLLYGTYSLPCRSRSPSSLWQTYGHTSATLPPVHIYINVCAFDVFRFESAITHT